MNTFVNTTILRNSYMHICTLYLVGGRLGTVGSALKQMIAEVACTLNWVFGIVPLSGRCTVEARSMPCIISLKLRP